MSDSHRRAGRKGGFAVLKTILLVVLCCSQTGCIWYCYMAGVLANMTYGPNDPRHNWGGECFAKQKKSAFEQSDPLAEVTEDPGYTPVPTVPGIPAPLGAGEIDCTLPDNAGVGRCAGTNRENKPRGSFVRHGTLDAPVPPRELTFNGRPLSSDQQARLEQVEARLGFRLPDRRYWYDDRTGLLGAWDQPPERRLPAGLKLGGPLPARCSLGGTGVFANGRELHPQEVAGLRLIAPVEPGRYWLDAEGNVGKEGDQTPAFNLVALARQAYGDGGLTR